MGTVWGGAFCPVAEQKDAKSKNGGAPILCEGTKKAPCLNLNRESALFEFVEIAVHIVYLMNSLTP